MLTLIGETGGELEAKFGFSLLIDNGHCTIVSMRGKMGLKYYLYYKYIINYLYFLYTYKCKIYN